MNSESRGILLYANKPELQWFLFITSVHRHMKMDSSLGDDFGPTIQNRAMEQIITPMTVQLCHLLISVERKEVQNKALASLQKVAEQLANASEEFVHVASR